MILYTNLMPYRFQGYNLGPVTLIRPAFRDDKGLHAHEAVHRAQFFRNPFMGLWYVFSKKARLKYEVEAFKAQLELAPWSLHIRASCLANHYGLGISIDEAVKLLSS